jgi:hypothetical protein
MASDAAWVLGNFYSEEFGVCPALRREGFPATLFRDADGKWWDVPDFWPETAFSASHREAELDAALALLAPAPTTEGKDGE